MQFKDMLRHRQAWLGVAMLWIMLFHLPFDLGPLTFPQKLGYGGVDICFFASGIGCYYSLTANSDVGSFMKRRLKRLMPTYFIFMIAWLIVQCVLGNFGVQMAIGNLLALQHFSGHENAFNWYIGAALLFYFLAPYFKTIVDRTSPLCKYLFPFFLFVCSIPFWRADTHIVTVSRLPIFYIGMLFADLCQQSKQITKKHIIFAIVSFLAGILSLIVFFLRFPDQLWSLGLCWYPFILITPPLCMALSYLLTLTENLRFMKPIRSFFSLCGDYSFELYLIHISLFTLIPIFIERLGLSTIRHFVWGAGILSLIPGCFLLRRLVLLFHRLCNYLQQRNAA